MKREGHDGRPGGPSYEERATGEALESTLRTLGPLLGRRTRAPGPRGAFVAALRHHLLAARNGGAANAGRLLSRSVAEQRPPNQRQGHTAARAPRRALTLVLLVVLGGTAVILARKGQTQEDVGTHGG